MLFPYSAVWEYQFITDATLTADGVWPDPTPWPVPASSWSPPAAAPFGTTSVPSNVARPYAKATDWAAGQHMWARRNVTLDRDADIILTGAIHSSCAVYWDGEFIGGIQLDNANHDSGTAAVIKTISVVIGSHIATEGSHELALLCMNRGSWNYFYAELDYAKPMMMFQPEAPAKETLEWLTDVLIAKDGTEDRSPRRLNPRRTLNLSYPVGHTAQQKMFNDLYGARTEEWLVPDWTRARLYGAIPAGQSGLHLTIDPVEFIFNDYSLLLIWESSTKWQLVSAYQTFSSTLAISSEPGQAFDSAWLIPVFPARMTTNPSKRFNGSSAGYSVTWEITEPAVLDARPFLSSVAIVPPQFLGNDIYYEPGLLNGDSTDESLVGQFDLHDSELGPVSYFAPWTYSRLGRTHRSITDDYIESWTLLQFIYRRQGRFKPFWQPSFESDLRLTSTGTLTTSIRVQDDNYQLRNLERTHFAIETAAGWQARTITGVTDLGGGEIQLTFSGSLAIAANDVRRVCWLGLKRLDTDRIELSWIGNGVCSSEARILEISP